MMPLTPNHLLLARSSNISPSLEYSGEDRFCARLAYVAQVEKEWWDLWIKQVLPTLFSYKKWKTKKENIEVGELVMIRYPGQFKDDYCLAKVIKADPDDDSLVRKVTVTYKKKNPRESLSVCKSRPMIVEEVAIHRLHRLELVDDEFVTEVPVPGAADGGLAGDVPQAVVGHVGHVGVVPQAVAGHAEYGSCWQHIYFGV